MSWSPGDLHLAAGDGPLGRRGGGPIRGSFRPQPRLDLWNDTFNISYQRFRQRVREIAELNHSRVDGAVRADWDQIPDGALVIPTDDDDWFSPDAARILETEVVPSVRGYLWTSRWIEVPINVGHRLYLMRRRLLPFIPPKWTCNANYAMLKDAEAKEILGSHITASRWFEQRLSNGKAKRVDGELSLVNRTLASSTSLRAGHPPYRLSRAELVRKFRRYKRLYHQFDTSGLDWCRPYVTMMAELMDQLELADGS
jgi:hypothetical protein